MARERTFLIGRSPDPYDEEFEAYCVLGPHVTKADLTPYYGGYVEWQPTLLHLCVEEVEGLAGLKLQPGQLVRCRLEVVEDLGVWDLPDG